MPLLVPPIGEAVLLLNKPLAEAALLLAPRFWVCPSFSL